jgi:ATP-dependent helicase/nuclease subunit B
MVERVFLGWDRPFLTAAVEWLLARKDELPEILLVVPTSQSGRRLREALAETGGAILAPQIATPGSLLKTDSQEIAEEWIERVAWMEILESVEDWTDFEGLFPEKPGEGRDWATGLAGEMIKLRRSLQENGLTLTTAARLLDETVETDRWEALGRLEQRVENQLADWKLKSRSQALAEGIEWPTGLKKIVLAGITEMPPLARRALPDFPGSVIALIGAPESEAANFSPIGQPVETWNQRTIPWKTGSVRVAADPRQQALEALKSIGSASTPSAQVALGSADPEVGEELTRTLTRAGWTAFFPGATTATAGLSRWFKGWTAWLSDPTLETMADLLTLPETGSLIGGKRARKAHTLARLRDRWMVIKTEDLKRRIAAEPFRTEPEKEAAEELLAAAETLETWRTGFIGKNFLITLNRLLSALGETGPVTSESAAAMIDWLRQAVPMIREIDRGARFWIDLMLSDLPPIPPSPPDGRVIDVQGWLELFYEPGDHLILCGMNEGKVPARGGGEPWLSESARKILGLITDENRAARDAYLYFAMLEARRETGRIDIICGKSGAGGEMLLPSRLLLAGERHELPGRVKQLFREIEPPEAGLRWQADWQWQPRKIDPPKRLNVTSLTDYLACPFRYYLKHVLKMQSSETGRTEWNARDFGTVAHEVLERWGRDEEARDFSKTETITAWMSHALDGVVKEGFGKNVPLAVRIQTEALRNRLSWFARVQACERASGWEIIEVEKKVEIPVGDSFIVAKIDRVDRHRETGQLRILDYKTGKIDGVEKAHRKKITASTKIPAHIDSESAAIFDSLEKGKPVQWLWHNLQLPLYASAWAEGQGSIPTPGYFSLRSTEVEVAIHEWTNFEQDDMESAKACADWIAGKINDHVFWPPAEKVIYDDYRILSAGRELKESVGEFTIF